MFFYSKLYLGMSFMVCCLMTLASGGSLRPVQRPLVFEKNDGQTDPRARFVARTGQGVVFLTKDGALLAPPSQKPGKAVSLHLVGASGGSPIGDSPTGGFANYYPTSDSKNWLEHIPLFAGVRYHEAYPGIDILFHGRQGELEYDFEVGAGASPRSISIALDGIDHLAIDAQGTLTFASGANTWRMLPPLAYQEGAQGRKAIRASYRLLGKNRVGFRLDHFDPASKLTIDPVVQYANIIIGGNAINVGGIQVDAAGDLIIAGDTGALNYPVVSGTPPSPSGSDQVYVTKLNPAGDTILYSTFLPASGFSSTRALALDASGNAYVTGVAGGSDFPFTSNLSTCATNCQGGFVAKLSATGSLVYAALLGTPFPRAITVDGSGNAYVAGDVGGNVLNTVNAFEPNYIGQTCTSCSNAFFAKLNPAGTAFLNASYFAAPNQTGGELLATGISLDSSGNLFIAGFTNTGGAPPLVNPWQSGVGSLFLAKFAPDAKTLLFSTQFGSSAFQNDTLTGMAVGGDGTIYLVGYTQAQDYPYSLNAAAQQIAPNGFASGTFSMFATAVNPALNGLTYSTYLGDGFTDVMALDSAGHLHVAGNSIFNLMPLQNAVVGDVTSGGFVLELDQTGTPVSVSQFGGHFAQETPAAIAVDGSGNTYVAGGFSPQNTSLPNQQDPLIVGTAMGQDSGHGFGSFFAKIAQNNSPQISLSPAPPFLLLRNAGSADLHISNVSFTGGLAKQWGNCGTTVPAGRSCVLTVTDANGGLAAGTVIIDSDANPSHQTFSISLSGGQVSGTPVGDQLIFGDVRFAYPPQLTGTSTAAIPMTISNVGTASATLNSVTTQGSASQTNDCGATIAPGTTCTVQVSLTAGGAQPSMRVSFDNGRTQDFFSFFLSPTTAQLLLSSSAINFGLQQVGGVAIPRVVTVTNTGNTSTAVPTASIVGAGEFVLAGNTCASSLPAHQSCAVGVQFNPQIDGSRSATLNIGSAQVSLSAEGMTASAVQVSPLERDYGPNIVGKGFTQSLTLTNSSSADIGIAGVSFSLPDYSETDNCAGKVPASSSCALQITFNPQQLGPRNGNVSVTFNGGVVGQVVTLTGTGITPMDVTPASLDYGTATPVGATSATHNVLLGNGHQGTSQAYSLALTGDFVIVTNTCQNPMPGFFGCANLQIAFAPKTPGPQQGSLTVSYPNVSVQSVVVLTGSGFGPAIVLPGSLGFANQLKGINVTQNLTLQNSGTAPLTISGISASGDFTQTNDCGTAVPAGQSCQVTVTFTPSATGPRTGTLTVNDNASGSPHTVALSGNGTDFQLGSNGGGTPSVTITSGQTATYNLGLTEAGGFTGTVTLACSGAPPVSTCNINPPSINVSGTATIPFTVTDVTTATSSAGVPGQLPWNTPTPLAIVLVGTLIVFATRFPRRARRVALATITVALILGINACGGGSSTPPPTTHPGTPSGTYTLVVTATSGGSSRQVQLNLIVQ